jgi:hypothetical protein
VGNEEPHGGPDGLNEDELVRKVVPDPSRPAQPTAVLDGLLGRSAREGHWRLYLTSNLSEYAEFKEEDLVHTEKIPPDQPPLVGVEATRVWLRQGAEVEYTRTESRRVQAEFLQGAEFATGRIREFPAVMGARRGGQPAGIWCIDTMIVGDGGGGGGEGGGGEGGGGGGGFPTWGCPLPPVTWTITRICTPSLWCTYYCTGRCGWTDQAGCA